MLSLLTCTVSHSTSWLNKFKKTFNVRSDERLFFSRYLVAINFGPNKVSRDFSGSHGTIPSELLGVIAMTRGTSYSVDDKVNPAMLEIEAYGAVVVSWDYVAKEL